MRFVLCALACAAPVFAQDTSMAHMPGMAGMSHMAASPLGVPMTRMGSGTSWLPDVSPMHAHHLTVGDWVLMLHYQVFVDYDHQESARPIDGFAQFNSINWFMGMAQHPLGDGLLTLRAMLSAEPLTVGKAGYPELLQTGESYRDQPLHDRQHPHDLFMELAALYDVPLTHDLALEAYAGPVGEPALGPPSYSHRPSAAGDPFAVLGHHWQDATHITFGVATLGLYTAIVKLEGSIFNGREPDETRTNFDLRTLDSYSGRLTVNPASDWSLSASYGYLKSPEELTPTLSQHRMTASVLFGNGALSSALVYGANLDSNDPRLSNSVDLESTYDLDRKNSLFGRIEYVQKSSADLVIPGEGHYDVEAVSAGYTREIAHPAHISMGLGGVVMVDAVPQSLEAYYGTRTPYGFTVFLRFRPTT
jgi:hypothetical protein